MRQLWVGVWVLMACGSGGLPVEPAAEAGADGGAPVARRVLVVDGATALRLAPRESAILRAVLFEGERPLEGAGVSFAIEAPAGGASIGAARVETDAWGRASTSLTAGGDARFTVRAEVEGAGAVSWDVTVIAPTHGELAVTVPFDGSAREVAALGEGRVRTLPGGTRCADLQPRGVLPTAAVEASLPGAGATARFRVEAGRYTLVAFFLGREVPVALAWGCREEVRVAGGDLRRITLVASPLTPVVVGPYTAVARYDFTRALPGALGDFTRTLVEAFDDRDERGGELTPPSDDPGYFIADLLLRQVFDDPSPLVVAGLAAIINTRLVARVPWLERITAVGSALAEVLSRLEVHSEVLLEKRSGAGLTARERWEAIVLRHAGRPYVFPLRDAVSGGMANVTAEMSVAEGEGLLRFAPHRMQIAYGRLALLALEQVILPAVLGVRTLRAALGALVDCNALARALAGTFLPIPASLCEAALDAADLLLRAGLDRLVATPSSLSREGSAHPVDADLDPGAVADELEAGVWRGSLRVGGEQMPFTATWTATRRGH